LLTRRLSAGIEGAQERVDVLRRLLRVYVTRLGRVEEARRCSEQILSILPDDEEAERALARILEERKEWGGLVEIWIRREARFDDRAKKTELRFRIARAQEEELKDLPAAAGTLRTILEQDPRNAKALTALARVSETTGDMRTVAEIVRKQIDDRLTSDPLASMLRLAQLYETALVDPERARAAYIEALDTDPVSPDAVAGLERLLEAKVIAEPAVSEVVARLIPYYELKEEYKKWAQALEMLVERMAAAERIGHLRTLVDLHSGPLNDTRAAFLTAIRIFELEPHDSSMRERLLAMAPEAQGIEDLLTAARRVLERVEESGFRRELLAYQAEIDEKRPGGGAEAERVYLEILASDPLHFGAYRSLTRIYRDAERWIDLRQLLEVRQENLPEPKERLTLLWQIAEIDEALLEDRHHAIATLQQISEVDRHDVKAFRALEKHYAAAQGWTELDALLERQQQMVAPEDTVGLMFRRAELLHGKLGQTSRALDLLEEVVSLRPTNREARILLESILPLPEHRQRTAAILEPLYEQNGDWTKLVGVLEAQIESRESMAAGALLGRIAGIEENKLHDATAALKTWRRVLAIEPDSMSALAEVERLAGQLKRQPELIPLYEELAAKNASTHLRAAVELLTRAAKLQVTLLGDREAAIKTWRRILELDSSNAETVRPAADALEILYAQIAEFRGFVDILRMKADWAADDGERVDILRRVAEIEEKSLGDLPAAVKTYRTLLDANDEDPGTLSELERLHERLGQHRERVDIMRRRLELSSSAETRRDLRFRMAVILERELSDVDEAISTVLAILDESADNVPALEILASLYERKGAVPERLEVLERRLQLATGTEARADILRGMAQLLEGPLARPQDALDRWHEVLNLQPADPLALERTEAYLARREDPLSLVAAQVLEPIYEKSGQWNKLAGLVELYVATDEDPRARMQHRLRLAKLQEERLGQPSAALESYGAAILDGLGEPQLGELLDAYERLSDAAGDSAKRIIDLYKLIESDIFDDVIRQRIARTLARRGEEIGDDALATEWHRKVLERSTEDGDTLAALERLYRKADDKPALLDVLQRRSELLRESPATEAPLRLQIGALAVTLHRRDEAVAAYERVMGLKPGDEEAYTALDRLYTESRQWRELVGLLDRQLARGLPSKDAVELHHRLAETHLGQLGDRHQAIVHISAALQLDQDHQPSIDRLEQLVGDPDTQVAAADLLEPVYVRRSAWTRLVAIDELRLERSEDPARRLALTQRIARVYEEQIEDLEAAFRWYGRLFRETPLDRTAQEQLLRLAPKLDRWRDVADWFARYLDQEASNSDEVLALVRLGAIVADERLGDRDAARKLYRRYVEEQPGDAVACRLYETALERWEAWEELRDLLEEHAARIPSPGDRIPYLRRSAALSADSLGDRARAASTLRSLLDIDASDARTATDLEALLRADERWPELRDHLMWMLEQVSEMGGDLNGIAFRLAEVEEQKLLDVDAAIDRYGEILGRMPRHAGALGALERLLANPEQRVRAARILEPHFRRTQEWRRLADVLEVSLETQDDSDKRAEVLIEIAGLEERLGRVDRALAARGRAWLEDVASTRNLAALEPLAASGRLYQPLVEILTSGTERAADSALCSALWSMIATVREARLGDAPGAIEAWRSAIAARPDDEESFVALERLLAQAGRQNELAEVLEQHLEIVSDTARRKALTKRMAVLFEDALKNPGKAIDGWRGVLDIDDADEEALDALARLYVASSQWRSLVDIYQRKIELSRDAQSLRYLRFLSARVYEEKLEEPHEAASQLRAVLDANPGDSDALAMLDRIFTREQQHIELLEVLDQRAAGVKGAEQDMLAFRAAELVENLGDTSGAIARYRDILTRNPGHETAREALWRIAGAEAFRLPAVAALEPVLRGQKAWAQLVELLELRLQVEETPGVRIEILTEIARIREKEQNDPKLAFEAWSAAFAEDPSETGPREALDRLAAASGEYSKLAEVYEGQLARSIDPELEQTLAWKVASLYEERLDDSGRAADFLRRIASVPGQEVAALARLETLLTKLGRWKDLEEVLQREGEVIHDATQQATLLASLGELRLGKLSDREGAVQAFRDALERLPTHPKALAALRDLLSDVKLRAEVVDILEPLAESRGDYAELASLYEVRVALESGGPERAMWWRRVAEIAESKLSDHLRALEALGHSLKEDPSVPDTAEALERVAVGQNQPVAAARAMEAALEQQSSSGLAELSLRAAALYERASTPKNAYHAEAERLYRRVLDEEAENGRALEALENLYRNHSQNDKLAKVLEQRGAVEMDAERRRGFYAEAARLFEGLGQTEAATAAWQSIRENDQGNTEALDELARLLEQQGNTIQLVAVLEDRARVSEVKEERASLFFRIGELRRGPLQDGDGAAAAFKEVLDISPGDRSALAALAALEEARGDFSALEEVLLRRLSVAEGTEKVDALLALARNAEERLHDLERAISYLHQILEIDPINRGATDRLTRLLEQNERWYDLIELFERRAGLEGGKDLESELASRLAIADIWSRRLGDKQSARESVDKVLARKADHAGALLALAALHEQDEHWGEAAAVLERAAKATGTPRDRAEVHFRRSRVLAAQGASDTEVESALRAALDADPDHPEAARSGEERARKQGDSARLVKLLEQRLKHTPAGERKALLTEIASLYRGPLAAPDRAISALTELAAQDSGDAQVQEELAAALAAAGRTDESEKILLDLAGKLGKAKQNRALARVQRALGGLAERRGDNAVALQRFEAAYQLDPAQPAVVASLGRLALSEGNSEKARRYFRALLLQSFDEKVAGITKAEVYLALGKLHLAANEVPKARNLFERGLETDPKNAELRQALASLPR
jgi:golgin subfamily B member 1